MFTYLFVMLSILQSQFIEQGFKKTENSEHNVVLLFLFTLDKEFLKNVKDKTGETKDQRGKTHARKQARTRRQQKARTKRKKNKTTGMRQKLTRKRQTMTDDNIRDSEEWDDHRERRSRK